MHDSEQAAHLPGDLSWSAIATPHDGEASDSLYDTEQTRGRGPVQLEGNSEGNRYGKGKQQHAGNARTRVKEKAVPRPCT